MHYSAIDSDENPDSEDIPSAQMSTPAYVPDKEKMNSTNTDNEANKTKTSKASRIPTRTKKNPPKKIQSAYKTVQYKNPALTHDFTE